MTVCALCWPVNDQTRTPSHSTPTHISHPPSKIPLSNVYISGTVSLFSFSATSTARVRAAVTPSRAFRRKLDRSNKHRQRPLEGMKDDSLHRCFNISPVVLSSTSVSLQRLSPASQSEMKKATYRLKQLTIDIVIQILSSAVCACVCVYSRSLIDARILFRTGMRPLTDVTIEIVLIANNINVIDLWFSSWISLAQ